MVFAPLVLVGCGNLRPGESSGAGASGGGPAAHWPTGEQGTGKPLGCLAREGRIMCVEAPYEP